MCLYNILVSGFYHYQSSLCYLSVSWSYVTLYIYRYVLEGPGTIILKCGRADVTVILKNVYRHVAFFLKVCGWQTYMYLKS